MNAVDILRNVENYFDRNHSLFCMWGGLFAAIFFTMYVPYSMLARLNTQMSATIDTYAEQNTLLNEQVDTMSQELKFLRLSYEEKQRVMREVECLAKNIYYEAGSEPRAGKIAVAEVTMNRVQSRQFPRTVCGVVYQRTKSTCQFSWVCEDKKAIRSRSMYRESLQIAENILISKRKYGIIGNAMYFHADYVDPAWSNQKVLVKQIGNHIFYH